MKKVKIIVTLLNDLLIGVLIIFVVSQNPSPELKTILNHMTCILQAKPGYSFLLSLVTYNWLVLQLCSTGLHSFSMIQNRRIIIAERSVYSLYSLFYFDLDFFSKRCVHFLEGEKNKNRLENSKKHLRKWWNHFWTSVSDITSCVDVVPHFVKTVSFSWEKCAI